MNPMALHTPKSRLAEIPVLLRGETEAIRRWSERWEFQRFTVQIIVIVLGAGAYGAAMGCWRAPLQAGYVAIKFPLIILLTTTGNALINGMLAPLLGLNIPLRQSFSAIVMGCAITSAILGAFSPLTAFLIWNAPDMATKNAAVYSLILLTQVAAIAVAGTVGNVRLFQLLLSLSGSRAVAMRVQCAWLAGNLFLGSQLSWILRPFIGSPDLPVQFVRQNAFKGNFYEAVFGALRHVF